MAPAQPTDSQPAAPPGPVYLDRFECVRAARRVKSAMRTKQRADEHSVSGDQRGQHAREDRHPPPPARTAVVFSHTAPPCPALPCRTSLRCRTSPGRILPGRPLPCRTSPGRTPLPGVTPCRVAPCLRSSVFTTTSSSAANAACPAVAARGLARNTSRLPRGRLCRYPATRCLRRRRTLFRTTASPTARLTMNPAFGGSSQPSRTSRCPTSSGRPYLRPPRIAAVKSVLRRMRAALGSIACHRQLDGAALVRR